MKISFEIKNYLQNISIADNKITDATCTCKWGTIRSNNFQEGKKICRHITQAVKKIKEKRGIYERLEEK